MNHGENVNITLVTYPQKDKNKFPAKIDKFYKDFKIKAKKYSKGNFSEHLFSPLKYHLFSNYDLALISITDTEKFAQKVFAPDGTDDVTSKSAYQVITGITKKINSNSNFNLLDSFNHLTKRKLSNGARVGKFKYVLISNICVNKGLLIGTGTKLLDKLSDLIDAQIRSTLQLNINKNIATNQYLLSKSYSWFDLSLVLFGDEPQKLIESLLNIRSIKYSDILGLDTNDTLYSLFGYSEKDIQNSHVIIETTSNLGAEYYRFKNGKDFIDDKLDTIIEWKVKAGYEKEFCEKISKIENCFDKNSINFTNGKMDFIFNEIDSSKISNNIKVFNALRNDKTFLNLVKRVKTNTLFNVKDLFTKEKFGIHGIHGFSEKLESNLTFQKKEIDNIAFCLKTAKVSRQLREKIIKCFYLVNAGLSDRVLFTYYIDFIPWLKRIKFVIEEDLKNYPLIKDIEETLIGYIIAFDRAYKNRTFNSYLFEDIHEYSIDYNASLQQLLTIYNSCVHILTRSYLKNEQEGKNSHRYNPRLLVNVNLNNTMSNITSINFHVHDLTAPELIFCLLHKEILNEYFKIGKIREDSIELNEFYIRHSHHSTQNILIDCYRYILTFNYDFRLYSFWFWSFNLQNVQLYNQNGFLNEDIFVHELIRFYTVKSIFSDNSEIDCPIPELFLYWNRYSKQVWHEVNSINRNNEIILRNINIKLSSFSSGYEKFEKHKILLSKKWKIDIKNNPELNNYRNIVNRNEWLSLAESFLVSKPNLTIIDLYKELKNQSKDGLEDSVILDTIIFCFLKKLYLEQSGKLALLRRNLITGSPLSSFIKNDTQDVLYYLDSQGGHFSTDNEKQKVYQEQRNSLLEILWDMTLVWKKEYCKIQINKT